MKNEIVLNFFGEATEFHHVGLVITSADALPVESLKTVDERQKAVLSFARMGGCLIEFIQPLGEDSPAFNYLKKGCSVYHICFSVADLQDSLECARENGFHPISVPVQAPALGNRRIAWVYSRLYGLFELMERNENNE